MMDIDFYSQEFQKKTLELLETIVTINSATDNIDGVTQVGELLVAELEDYDVHFDRRSVKEYGDLFFIESNKKDDNKPTVLLCGHIDMIIPAELAQPFTVTSDRAYGSGISDMKGGLLVMLAAFKALVVNETPNVALLFVPDEEVDSIGYAEYLNSIYQRYTYGLVFEKADKNTDNTSPTEHFNLVTERKGCIRLGLRSYGASAHAGTTTEKEDRHSAIHQLVTQLNEIMKLEDFSRGTTVNVGTIRGGVSYNTIAPEAYAEVDMRFVVNGEFDRVMQEVRDIVSNEYVVGTRTEIVENSSRPPLEYSKKSKELITLAEKVGIDMGITISASKRGGASDGNTMGQFGMGVLDALGPFGEGDHDPESYISLESLWQRMEFVARLVAEILK